MKRKFKRIASLVLAAVMVFAMAMPAMADELKQEKGSTDCQITINGVTGTDHVFKAYQIFVGDVYDKDGKDAGPETESGKDEVLSNIDWGSALDEAGQAAFVKAVFEEEKKPTPSATEVAKKLAEKSSADLQAIIEAVKGDLKTEAGTSTEKTGDTYTITGLNPGYYLVIDSADATLGGDYAAYSSYIVEVVGRAEVTAKAEHPKLEKKVQEKNDSTDAAAEWQDGADYDIGDEVPFKLEATLPGNYAEYDTYKLIFHDKMSDGLTFTSDSIKVTCDGTTIEFKDLASKEITLTAPADDEDSFDLTIKDVKTLFSGAKAGDVITVEFTAKLDGDAVVIGPNGNTNTAKLEYSNNPNNAEETGTTPEDKVVVFTFEVDVNKVEPDPIEGNENHTKPLEGAAFTLYKWVSKTDAGEENELPNGVDDKAPAGGVTDGYWKSIEVIDHTGDHETKFEFKGEDSGIYKLVETVTPPGYNTAEPIDFTINATYDTESATPQLKTLTITPDNGKFTVTKENGTVTTDVINKKGATLPETGGIGTTIFYVVGSVLVLGAVILLVTKRRMKAD